MPRLNNADDTEQVQQKIGGSGFSFKGARIDHLGATEYTLVTIAVDETGSVLDFKDELRKMLVMAVESCKKSPRSDNILIRVIKFSDRYTKGVQEVHGFKPLSEIDTASYPEFNPGGMTPLYDAGFSMIGAMNTYGKQLQSQEFGANGIGFLITDGDNNASTATEAMIMAEAKKSVSGETLESLITVLIGVNVKMYSHKLLEFQKNAGITQFIDAGDATPRKLAKIADFVSSSVSSQSQSLGTGGPSQNIAPSI